MPKSRNVNAVKMKRVCQRAFQARIAGMSVEEELAFYRKLEKETARGKASKTKRTRRRAGSKARP